MTNLPVLLILSFVTALIGGLTLFVADSNESKIVGIVALLVTVYLLILHISL